MKKRPCLVFWFTGLSGSGKTTIADKASRTLSMMGKKVRVYDGDVVRAKINRHLTFSPGHIKENNRVIAELCRKERGRCDYIFVPIISPFSKIRKLVKGIMGDGFYLVYVKASLDEVIRRDAKGLYGKALAGKIKNFIGISEDTPYQAPRKADLILDTEAEDAERSASRLIAFVNSIEQRRSRRPRFAAVRERRCGILVARRHR